MKVGELTDEMIRGLTCTICGNRATCIGSYEDMPYPGEPACDECCGHGCEDGHCEPLFDEDGDITQDIPWADDSTQGTRMRARIAAYLTTRTGRGE